MNTFRNRAYFLKISDDIKFKSIKLYLNNFSRWDFVVEPSLGGTLFGIFQDSTNCGDFFHKILGKCDLDKQISKSKQIFMI